MARFCVKRDYSEGLLTQWESSFPSGLEEYGVQEEEFQDTIQRLNVLFHNTEQYRCTTFLEACLGFFSCYTYYLCIPGQYYRGKTYIELYIEQQNEIYADRNIRWLNPFRNGLVDLIIVAEKKEKDHPIP